MDCRAVVGPDLGFLGEFCTGIPQNPWTNVLLCTARLQRLRSTNLLIFSSAHPDLQGFSSFRWISPRAVSQSPSRLPSAPEFEVASIPEVPGYFLWSSKSLKVIHLEDAPLNLIFSNLHGSALGHRLKKVDLTRGWAIFCSTQYSSAPVLCSFVGWSRSAVALFPDQFSTGWVEVREMSKDLNKQGFFPPNPIYCQIKDLLVKFECACALVTWTRWVSWSLVDRPLCCWSSWTVLKVVIDLRKHKIILNLCLWLFWAVNWKESNWVDWIPWRLPRSCRSSYWSCPSWKMKKCHIKKIWKLVYIG